MSDLNGHLSVKVDQQELDIFNSKVKRQLNRSVPHFIREIITAFNDGRLRIVPTEEQKQQLGELYES